eukprot:1407701-Pyramimonas_sp.AAC.1
MLMGAWAPADIARPTDAGPPSALPIGAGSSFWMIPPSSDASFCRMFSAARQQGRPQVSDRQGHHQTVVLLGSSPWRSVSQGPSRAERQGRARPMAYRQHR